MVYIFTVDRLSQLKQDGVKLVKLDTSKHIPVSLHLSPAEVKIFAGHTLNLLRTKCHNVDSLKIHQIQRYISQRHSAKIDQAVGRRKDFNSVLGSIRTCSSTTDYRQILSQQNTFLHTVFKNLEELGIPPFYVGTMMSFFQYLKDKINPIAEIFKQRKENQKNSRSPSIFDASDDRPGEDRFARFLDDLVLLYSKSCHSSQNLIFLFKGASKDFFSYLTVDKITTQKAADFYLTSDFLQNITTCVQNFL
ncbi:unnamed protein product [Allacma fusca]|uniref:Uncharacterized protein n=1 Tax=Allacma fusca TaxID=39272 RepID=A0A8J2NWI1_9HEXA|nr:unnamed protein product [Allacma fusca]